MILILGKGQTRLLGAYSDQGELNFWTYWHKYNTYNTVIL